MMRKQSDEIIESIPFDLNREQYDKLRAFIGEIAYKKGFNSALDEVEKIIDITKAFDIKDDLTVAYNIKAIDFKNELKEKIKEMRK